MADIKYYDVILKPVITEKSMNVMGEKKYTFLVHPENVRRNKSKERKHHEHGWKEKTSRCYSW